MLFYSCPVLTRFSLLSFCSPASLFSTLFSPSSCGFIIWQLVSAPRYPRLRLYQSTQLLQSRASISCSRDYNSWAMTSIDPVNSPLRIASHNVQRLNSPVKRHKLFPLYHSQKMYILLLQETHFPVCYAPSFIHHKYAQFYLANAEDKMRVVAIFFAKHLNFSLPHVIRDPNGRYILLSGSINGTVYTFLCYYASNRGQATFFSSLAPIFTSHTEGSVILSRDSHIAVDLSLDKSGGGKSLKHPLKQSLRIARILHSLGLIDIWRELNPQSKYYSHFSALHQTYSRIDHIFVPTAVIPLSSRSLIRDTALPDHDILLLLTHSPDLRGPFSWRLNMSILSGPVQCTILEKELKEFFLTNNLRDIYPETLWATHKAMLRGKLI